MDIYLTENGQQLGPYTVDEINQRLKTGAITSSELAWHAGIADWAPLSSLPGVTVTPPLPTAEPAPFTPSPSPLAKSSGACRDYKEVPWYRRSSTNSLFILGSLLSAGWFPGTLITCFLVLTGDIYTKNQDAQGNLKTWGRGNKVAAMVLLLINACVIIHKLLQ